MPHGLVFEFSLESCLFSVTVLIVFISLIRILISFISWVITSGLIPVWLFSYVWCVSFWHFRVFYCFYYFSLLLESNVFGVFYFGYIFFPFPDFTIFGSCGVIFFLQLMQNGSFWQSVCFVLFSPHLPHIGGGGGSSVSVLMVSEPLTIETSKGVQYICFDFYHYISYLNFKGRLWGIKI